MSASRIKATAAKEMTDLDLQGEESFAIDLSVERLGFEQSQQTTLQAAQKLPQSYNAVTLASELTFL